MKNILILLICFFCCNLIAQNPYGRHKAVTVKDIEKEIALGNISNNERIVKFGTTDILAATGSSDLWLGGGEYTGQPDTFDYLTIESNSALDAFGSTGANIVFISGLDSNWLPVNEYVELNGSTVETVNKYIRMPRAYVDKAGSLKFNQGDIDIYHTNFPSNIFAKIQAGSNSTTIGAWSMAENKTGLINDLLITCTRTNGSAGGAEVKLLYRDFGKAWRELGDYTVGTSAPLRLEDMFFLLKPKSDFKIVTLAVSDNNTKIAGNFIIEQRKK